MDERAVRPKTREEAKKKEKTRYYTGKACVRGHFGERYTRNGECVGCRLEERKGKMKKGVWRSEWEGRKEERDGRMGGFFRELDAGMRGWPGLVGKFEGRMGDE